MTQTEYQPQNQNRKQRFRPEDYERDPTKKSTSSKSKAKRKSRSDPADDTPKAFARLMRWKAEGRKPDGLDNGDSQPKGKKRKRNEESNGSTPTTNTKKDITKSSSSSSTTTTKTINTQTTQLKLLPGERMSDFSRRVDAAIPLSLKGTNKTGKLEKKAAAAQKKAPIPTLSDEEDEADNWDFDDNGDPIKNPTPSIRKAISGGNNNNKKLKRVERSPSPFAELRNKRPKPGGINDVVQAPPTISVKPKNVLRAVGVDVPKSAGSLARREALADERMGIVERYRALMDAKRSGGGGGGGD